MLILHVFDFELKINKFNASQMCSFGSDDIFLKSIVFSQKEHPYLTYIGCSTAASKSRLDWLYPEIQPKWTTTIWSLLLTSIRKDYMSVLDIKETTA